jgi:hypothetical protein
MRTEQHNALAKIALALCLVGVALAIVVGVLALTTRTWTTLDANNVLMGTEAAAFFLGALAYRSGTGISAMIISGVLILGAFLLR